MMRRDMGGAAGRIADRGVYEHPFIGPEGERYLFAVDSRGRRVLETTVFPSCVDPGLVTASLRRALDELDPKVAGPRLLVIAGGAR
jgi:hypothetical protein